MADMLKIGVKTIAPKEIQPEKQELKLYIGEKISARVEKGGNGEGVLTVKGFQINAKGNTEFKNGDVISLRIKGMEDGNILVETVKEEEKTVTAKVMEEKNLKTVKLKEEIIREGIEQKTALSGEKIEKIANSYREIEAEAERIKKEKTEKKNEVFSKETAGKKESENSSKTGTADIKRETAKEEKIDEKPVVNLKGRESDTKKSFDEDELKTGGNRENTEKAVLKNSFEERKNLSEKQEKTASDLNLDKKGVTAGNSVESKIAEPDKNEPSKVEAAKKEVLEKIIKESGERTEAKTGLKEGIENRGKEPEKENSIVSKESKKTDEELKEEEKSSKTLNLDAPVKKESSRLKEQSLNIIQNSTNRDLVKELAEKYSKKERSQGIEDKNIVKELGKFIAEKESEFNEKTGKESIKTLVKLENSPFGLNPEAFKLLHSFYGQEMSEKIEIDENLKESIKSFIKNISEGESSEAKGTLLANVINRSEGNNTLEFLLNIAQFKSPCEIKIVQENGGSEERKVKKIKYFTVKLELEKLGKMAVTVLLDDKNSTEIYFAVEDEDKKKLVASEFDKLSAMFQAKGINIGNIRISDKKRADDKVNGSLDFKI